MIMQKKKGQNDKVKIILNITKLKAKKYNKVEENIINLFTNLKISKEMKKKSFQKERKIERQGLGRNKAKDTYMNELEERYLGCIYIRKAIDTNRERIV